MADSPTPGPTPTPTATPAPVVSAPSSGPGSVAFGQQVNADLASHAAAMAKQGLPPTATVSPSLLVTSGASRSNYANNVTTLNNAVGNLSVGGNQVNPSGTTGNIQNGSVTTPTPPSYDNATGQLTDYGKSIGAKDVNGTGSGTGGSASGNGTSDTSNEPDTNGLVTASDGTKIDPSVKDAYESTVSQMNDEIANAKNTLSSALSTLQNDPSATAAIQQIEAKYDQITTAMQNKNKVILGRSNASVGAFGGLGQMSQNFMSDEMDAASQRLSNILTQESGAILRAQEAYKKGDIGAFDAASKYLDKLNTDKSSAISKLLTASDNAVKQRQAEAKAAQTLTNQTITNDIKLSTSLGTAMAKELSDSGVTDPKQIEAYVKEMATQNGISNPEVLNSALVKAQGAASKADLSAKNTNSIITKRNNPTPKKTGVNTYSTFTNKPSTATITKVNAYLQSIGTNPAGLKAANSDEETFYKVLNAIPKSTPASANAPV